MKETAGQGGLVLEVRGMTCGGCARAVEAAIAEVPGVTSARVDLAAGRAKVQGNGVDAGAVVSAVEDAGFTASMAE